MSESDAGSLALPWELSAPETLVLLWGPDTGAAWVVKLALQELIVRRTLRLFTPTDRRRLFFAVERNVIARGRSLHPGVASPLRAVMQVFPEPRTFRDGASGVAVEDLARTVFTGSMRKVKTGRRSFKWDRSHGGFVEAEVLPALEQRGLYARNLAVSLGFISSTRWSLTRDGNTSLIALRELMEQGRSSFPTWVTGDRDRARSFVERARAALLLLPGSAQQILALARLSPGDDAGRRNAVAGAAALVDTRGFAIDGSSWEGDPFALAALAETFGPRPGDTYEDVFHIISADVDRAWSRLQDGGGE